MLVSQGLLLLLICGTHGHLQEFFGFKDVVPPVAVPVNVPSSSLSSLLCTSSSTICYRDNIRLCVNQQPIDASPVVHTCTYGCSPCENGPHICNDEKGNSRCAQANSDRFVKECSPEQQGKSFCSGGDVRYCNSSNLAVLVEYCDARGCQSDPLSCHEPAVRQTRSLLQKAKGKTMVQMSSTNTTTTNSTVVTGGVSNSAASSSAGANSNANSNANNAAAMTGASSGSGNGNAWNSASAMGSGNGMTNSSTSTTVTSTGGASSGAGSAPSWNINMNAPSTQQQGKASTQQGKARTIVTTNSTTVVTNTTTIISSASSGMTAMASNCSGVDTTQPLVRVEWASMPDADRLRYINAVRALYAQGDMQQLAQLHYNNRNQTYGTGVYHFLIWHRVFLNDFEQRLRALPGYGCVTVPFWTYDYSGQPLDRRSLFGTNATKLGQAAQAGCLGGAFANVTQSLNGTTGCVTRNPNSALLGALSGSQFTDLIQLDQSDFATFSDDLQTIQGLPHVALGGFMTTQWSPIDPAFFVHHANVDRLWSMWQDCHQNYQWSEAQGLQQPIAGYSGVTAGDFINNNNISWKGQRQSVQYEANAIGNPTEYSSDFRRRIVTSCQSGSMLSSQVSPIIGVDSWATSLRGQAGPIMNNVTLSCSMNTNMTGLYQLPIAPVAVYDNMMLQDCVMLCGSFYFKSNGTSNCACTTFNNGGVSNVSLGAAMNWFSANCGNGSTYGFYQSNQTVSTNGRRLLQTQQQPGLTMTTQNSGATTIASTPQAGNGVSTSMGSASSGGSTSMGISTSSSGVTTSTSSASNGSSSSVATAGAPAAPTPRAPTPIAAAATTVSVRNVTNVTTTVTNVTSANSNSNNNNNNNNNVPVVAATATSTNSSATRSVVNTNANGNAPVTNVTSTTNSSVTTVNTTVANSNVNAPVAATNSNSNSQQNNMMMMNNGNSNSQQQQQNMMMNNNGNSNAASSGSSEESSTSSNEASSMSSSESSSMSSNEASMEGSGESVVTTVTTTNVTNVTTVVQKQLILSNPPPAVCFVSYASTQRMETACSSQASSPAPLPRDWLVMNNLNPDNANVCNLFVPANRTVTSNCVWSYD